MVEEGFAHAHLLNIIKGTKQSLFNHKQRKDNGKLYSLVFFCPNNKKMQSIFKKFCFPRKQRKLIEAGGATEEQQFVNNSLQQKR